MMLYLVICIVMSHSLILSQDLSDIDQKLNDMQFNEAKVDLEKLNNQYPSNYEILTRMAIGHHYIGEQSYSSEIESDNTKIAYEYINEAYKLNNSDAQILKWYTVILGKTVENENLRTQIELSKKIEKSALIVIEKLPEDEFCYNILGQWHFRLASLGPTSRRIASLIFSEPPKGSFKQAKYFLEQSMEINPSYIGTYYWLGMTYMKLDQYEKAKKVFEKGLDLERPFKREEEIFKKLKKELSRM